MSRMFYAWNYFGWRGGISGGSRFFRSVFSMSLRTDKYARICGIFLVEMRKLQCDRWGSIAKRVRNKFMNWIEIILKFEGECSADVSNVYENAFGIQKLVLNKRKIVCDMKRKWNIYWLDHWLYIYMIHLLIWLFNILGE